MVFLKNFLVQVFQFSSVLEKTKFESENVFSFVFNDIFVDFFGKAYQFNENRRLDLIDCSQFVLRAFSFQDYFVLVCLNRNEKGNIIEFIPKTQKSKKLEKITFNQENIFQICLQQKNCFFLSSNGIIYETVLDKQKIRKMDLNFQVKMISCGLEHVLFLSKEGKVVILS